MISWKRSWHNSLKTEARLLSFDEMKTIKKAAIQAAFFIAVNQLVIYAIEMEAGTVVHPAELGEDGGCVGSGNFFPIIGC